MKSKKESMVIDYLLVVLYFLVVIGLWAALKMRSDFVMQWLIPGVLIVAVSAIFLNYLSKILSTSKNSDQPK